MDRFDRVLTPEEVAEELRLSLDTVKRRLRQGKLAGRTVGRSWRIRRSDMEQFLAAKPVAEDRAAARHDRAKRVQELLGQFAHVRTGSEECCARKQEEIDIENRRWPDESA